MIKKYILIRGKDPTQRLDDTKLTAEADTLLVLQNRDRIFYITMEAAVIYLSVE